MEINKIKNIYSLISKEMNEVLHIQNKASKDNTSLDALPIEEVRIYYNKEREFWNEGGDKVYKSVDSKINTRHGAIPVRFYYPNNNENNMSALIYIHGGGFIVGNLDTHDRIMRAFAYHANVIVMGIDYTLSPEAKFPQALEECVDIIKYLHENGDSYKIDKNSLSLAGDSGGANLCLASTIYLREVFNDISYIKSLLLYYGFYGLKDSVSKRLYGGDYDGLKKEDLDYYFNLYTKNEKDYDNIYFSPLNADLTKNIPPCYIETGELDPLCDDSIVLYKILSSNGIKTELKVIPHVIHSYLHYAKMLKEASKAIENGSKFLNSCT